MKNIAFKLENDLYFDLLKIKDNKSWAEFLKVIADEKRDAM